MFYIVELCLLNKSVGQNTNENTQKAAFTRGFVSVSVWAQFSSPPFVDLSHSALLCEHCCRV